MASAGSVQTPPGSLGSEGAAGMAGGNKIKITGHRFWPSPTPPPPHTLLLLQSLSGVTYLHASLQVVEDCGFQDEGLTLDHRRWQCELHKKRLENKQTGGWSKSKAMMSCAEHPCFPFCDGVRHSDSDGLVPTGAEEKQTATEAFN